MDHETLWLSIGLLGQALFSARFFVQWLQSERQKKSVFPVAFWYFSIGGGITLLAYAIHKEDPVFIIGQASGLFIYLRNLYFVVYEKKLVV
ncbi:lipid-A-disaccharide synthase N-terminal domain-containing protein [Methylotuvimicrobium sp. KM1]|uniref:lipid-A-disaccharide synthase N-terminal domain-containing protein n=1 Tax=Methylotuvimicrobium sp. KM1 TaxID=3377707 RepID=UPI00384CA811